ncbi:polysaccharide biosynthesis protein [Alteromonas naphthalenivorans]|uniref:Polysaccharide biosynthesis protein n=2 Tax=Alteromonas naphthalenivorans TaxID=715451 RepID=F5ZD22_ALTNA|nr:polysaccharide biosynthesis protein [Alteromonas naphthalenivorans]
MAIAQVILQGLVMVSDLGLVPSIVRSKNVSDSRFLNTAWTLQFIRNCLLWMITLAISFPIATFYERSELVYLIPLAALALLVSGLFPIKVILASRSMNLFRVTSIQLAGQVIGTSVSVILAFYYKNALIFVIGALLAELSRLFLYRCYLKGANNSFEWHKPSVHELFTFGKWIFVSSTFGFVVQHANVFILGKLLAAHTFGIYTVALVLAMLPITVCHMLNGKVLLPLFSEMSRNGASVHDIQKGRYIVLAGGTLVTLFLMFISPYFFPLLYDDRYSLAGYISLLVLMASLPELLLIVTLNKLMVDGRSKTFALLTLFRGSLLVILGITLATSYGIVGVCIASLISGLTTYILALKVKGMGVLVKPTYEALIFIVFFVVSVGCIFLYSEGLTKVTLLT